MSAGNASFVNCRGLCVYVRLHSIHSKSRVYGPRIVGLHSVHWVVPNDSFVTKNFPVTADLIITKASSAVTENVARSDR